MLSSWFDLWLYWTRLLLLVVCVLFIILDVAVVVVSKKNLGPGAIVLWWLIGASLWLLTYLV